MSEAMTTFSFLPPKKFTNGDLVIVYHQSTNEAGYTEHVTQIESTKCVNQHWFYKIQVPGENNAEKVWVCEQLLSPVNAGPSRASAPTTSPAVSPATIPAVAASASRAPPPPPPPPRPPPPPPPPLSEKVRFPTYMGNFGGTTSTRSSRAASTPIPTPVADNVTVRLCFMY